MYYALYADSVYLILCSSLTVLHSDVLHSVYYALYADSAYLILCSSLNVLHSDVLHSVYYALYADSVYLILCSSLIKGFARKNPSRCFRENWALGFKISGLGLKVYGY